MSISDHDHPLWGILESIVSYIPAAFCMLLTTNKWDGEYLVIGALLAGKGGHMLWKNMQKAKVEDA